MDFCDVNISCLDSQVTLKPRGLKDSDYKVYNLTIHYFGCPHCDP